MIRFQPVNENFNKPNLDKLINVIHIQKLINQLILNDKILTEVTKMLTVNHCVDIKKSEKKTRIIFVG